MSLARESNEAEALLPFYLTGRLAEDELHQMEEFVVAHPEQLALAVEERRAVAEAYDELKSLPRADFSAIATRLASLNDGRDRARNVWHGIRGFFVSPEPRMVQWAAAVAGCLLLAQAGVIGTLTAMHPAANFATASGGGTALTEGSLALVRFVDGATASAIANTLDALGMTIVDGPAAGGLFTLRIGARAMTDAEREQALAVLRRHPDVVAFATRINGDR